MEPERSLPHGGGHSGGLWEKTYINPNFHQGIDYFEEKAYIECIHGLFIFQRRLPIGPIFPFCTKA